MGNLKFNNMKILFICTTDNMIWQFLTPHIRDLISYGAKVDCVCSKTGFWFDSLKDMGFNMIDIKFKRSPINLTNFKAYNKLKKLQKQNNYNLIYCQQPTGGLMGRFIGKKFKLPVIYTAHGFFFFKGNNKLKNLVYRSAERYMAKYTDILITMNNEDFESAKKFKAKKKYLINGIGLDVKKFSLKNEELKEEKNSILQEDIIELKNELNISLNDRVILSVSEFIPRKNYKTMLETISKLAEQRGDFKYLMCGTGWQLEEMKTLAKKLDILQYVRFLGYRTDIDKIMKISDIFFHQSFHEGLTMGIIEAMYFGLPVVTSRVRGNQDLIDENLGGFLTSPIDIETQVASLNKLLDDAKLRSDMGSYNQQKVGAYKLQVVRDQLKAIYKENGFFD